ncbi:MAG: extracellular solute-binding protein [Chloroflexi bacterium]|nr:extracellular solute-binding protein [Chloroflexota bacterium]
MQSKIAVMLFALGLGAAGATAVGVGPSQAGMFDGVEIRVASYGGKWRNLIESTVGQAFAAEGGKLVYVAGSPAPNVAKLIASRGSEPPFDLMETLDDFLDALDSRGYLDEIDLSKIPNAAFLAEQDKSKSWVKTWTTQSAIIYNKEQFKKNGIPVPTKYADLKHAKLQGRISIPDIAGGGIMPCIVGMALEGGGDESNIDPALELIASLDIKAFWKSSSSLQTLFKSGDVWAACAGVHNVGRLMGVVPMWASHIEVKPGIFGVLKQGWLVKIKGGKNDKARDWIINEFLSEKHQRGITKGWLLPSREDILADFAKDPEKAFMRLKPDQVKNMYTIDFSKVDRTVYTERWNRKVISGQ